MGRQRVLRHSRRSVGFRLRRGPVLPRPFHPNERFFNGGALEGGKASLRCPVKRQSLRTRSRQKTTRRQTQLRRQNALRFPIRKARVEHSCLDSDCALATHIDGRILVRSSIFGKFTRAFCANIQRSINLSRILFGFIPVHCLQR